jgi:hypothetical protein
MLERLWPLALGLAMWAGAMGGPCWGAPPLEKPALDVRILRDGELASIRLVGEMLLIDSPSGARTRELTVGERQGLLAAATAVAAKGNGPLTCEREEMYVHLRLGEREAAWVLCQGGRPAEAPWRRFLETLRQLIARKTDGGS